MRLRSARVACGLARESRPRKSEHVAKWIGWLRRSGHRIGSVAIVRPDKFVFALVRASELAVATREFTRQMHCAEAVLPPAEARRTSLVDERVKEVA